MGLGDYDEDEHERRERKSSAVDTSATVDRHDYDGSIDYNSGDSAERLLDTFEQIKSD